MTKKPLYKFSLTWFDILILKKLENEGKHAILVGDNTVKVVDKND